LVVELLASSGNNYSINNNNGAGSSGSFQLYYGDALSTLKDKVPSHSIDACVTSPPYWGQRYYGDIGPDQLGIELDHRDYIAKLATIFGEQVARVLKPTGSLWIVISDTINGHKTGNTNGLAEQGSTIGRAKKGLNEANARTYKTLQRSIPEGALLKIPAKLAIELESKYGLVHRDTIIWDKVKPMPESVMSRCGKAYEEILFFTKKSSGYHFNRLKEPAQTPKHRRESKSAYRFGGHKAKGYDNPTYSGRRYDSDGRKEGTRYMRNIWSISTNSDRETAGHFAPFPLKLAERIIKTACLPTTNGGTTTTTVLDPFMGSGTAGVAALRLGHKFVGIDLNCDYVQLTKRRLDRGLDKYLV
jgi:DNA modification methylase